MDKTKKFLIFLAVFTLFGFSYAENVEEQKIYIVTNLTFQDAVSVSGILDENDIMLITDQNFLPEETENFLKNMSNREIIIVGGNFVIKENVRKKIKEISKLRNLTLREIYGKEAEDTAMELIKFKFGTKKINTLIIVNKHSIEDCFSSSSIASLMNIPIAYTEKDEIPNSTINIIEKFNVKEIIIVGGEGIISKEIENTLIKYNIKVIRKWGITAKETNEKVKEFLKEKIKEIYRIEKNISNSDLLNLQFKKFYEIGKKDKKESEKEIYKKIKEKIMRKSTNVTTTNVTIKTKEKIEVPKDFVRHIMKDDEILKYVKNDIVVFKFLYNPGCSHCRHGAEYLPKLKEKFKDRIVIEKTQIYDSENWKTFSQECISRGLRYFPFTISIGKNALINGNISYDLVSYSEGFDNEGDYNTWVSNICYQFENKPDVCYS